MKTAKRCIQLLILAPLFLAIASGPVFRRAPKPLGDGPPELLLN